MTPPGIELNMLAEKSMSPHRGDCYEDLVTGTYRVFDGEDWVAISAAQVVAPRHAVAPLATFGCKPSPPQPSRRERCRRWLHAVWYRITPAPRAWIYGGSDGHCWGSFYAMWLAKFWCWRNNYTYDVISTSMLVVHDWETEE